MDGKQFIRSLSGLTLSQREDAIYNAVKDSHHRTLEWRPVRWSDRGHDVEVIVTCLPLAIGCEKPVQLNVSAKLAQRIIALKGWAPFTARIADRVFQLADARIAPQTQPPDSATRLRRGYSASMADVEAMIRASEDVSAARDSVLGYRPGMLVANCGKHWVLTRKRVAGRAANYGWHTNKGGYQPQSPDVARVLQPMAFAHGPTHVDYSQVLYGLEPVVRVDGVAMPLEKALQHPEFSWLFSSEGPIPNLNLFDAVAAPVKTIPVQRNLRRGMYGDDVRQLEAQFGWPQDGMFDAELESFVREYQRQHGLLVDGVVGPATRGALAKNPPQLKLDLPLPLLSDTVDIDNLPQQPAKNYLKVTRPPQDIHYIVLHSMEAPEKPTTAESVSAWAAGKSGEAPPVSWHLAIDNDSVVQGVPFAAVAYHAGGGNRHGLGLEHAGYARQSEAEWLDDYSAAMLWLSAQCVAQLCKRYRIPMEYVDAEGLKRGQRGITTHNDITKAFRKSTHTDPGTGFPMAHYLKLVRQAAQQLA